MAAHLTLNQASEGSNPSGPTIMKNFQKTYPHLAACKSLDLIADELNYNDYIRGKILSTINTSHLMFKEVAKIKNFSHDILYLVYRQRCQVVDNTNWSFRAKDHIKNIINASYKEHVARTHDTKENKNG